MGSTLTDKIIIEGRKYILFNEYCEIYNKDPRTVRGSMKEGKLIYKRFNNNIYIRTWLPMTVKE